jgi:ABC-type branched-subunit amino acid transport system ATPase component/ABC-type branched-subunit amino acid transport system permease subunit
MADLAIPASQAAKAPRFGAAVPYALLVLAAIAIPFVGEDYWTTIATRAAVYWVLVGGLNLVVGFAGQLAIGYVALLTVGAYTASALAEKLGVPAPLALVAAGFTGALGGVLVGLPALRLRTFYFAMSTLGFATIVTQVALAWTDVTGGGVGLPGPTFPAPFASTNGFYALCMVVAALVTWLSANAGFSRFGRSLVALRDAEVAAEACGVGKRKLLLTIFLFSGASAGVAGALFATVQSYITPDAFTFDLSVLFFTAILIGGRGAILGPLLATALLTVLPEFAAPLVAWSTFLYAALLLIIVLLVPGGIADLLDRANRRPLHTDRQVVPRAALLPGLLSGHAKNGALVLSGLELSFGAVRAIDGLDLRLEPGEVHGLIGPNGSGKTTTLNAISGFARPQLGQVAVGMGVLLPGHTASRAAAGIARTFQTPRVAGEASVLDNVMLGGTIRGRASFVAAMLSLPQSRREEAALRERAVAALRAMGLERLATVRADRLQHSELRFVEIARALMAAPAFLLLDEPAAGLSADEIARLGELVRAIAAAGTGVLLVEHHADLIFAVCDRVTVLNLGRILAAGTPAEIRAHREVVEAYLGA